MKRVTIDKRGSVTAQLSIATQALLSEKIQAQRGEIIAAKVLERSQRYGHLEDIYGRQVEIHVGDVVVGALGQRHALHGHGGVIPETLEVGDTIHMLNLGGVMGICKTSNPMVGPPTVLEVLGSVLTFPVIDSREGVPANLNMSEMSSTPALQEQHIKDVPILVIISGTCMNAGKTLAASAAVRALKKSGMGVDAAKFTGVAARKDVLSMLDCGATKAMTFGDVGLPSTSADSAPHSAKQLLYALSHQGTNPDVIVVEMGDGLLGAYGVMEILKDPIIAQIPTLHVCCASDPVGSFGAMALFANELKKRPDIFSGPVTDNHIGCQQIREQLHTKAFNAIIHTEEFGAAVVEGVKELQKLKHQKEEV